MIAIPYSPNFTENMQRRNTNTDALPCAVCGKSVTQPRYWVHVHCGGAYIVTEEEAAELDTAADMGFFPLGSDCRRKHLELRPYAYKDTGSDYDPADDDRFLAYQYNGE